jgi:hypothetical protein
MDTLIAELSAIVKEKMLVWLHGRELLEMVSLTVVQEAMTQVGRAAAEAVGAAWREALVRLAEAVRPCPGCGRPRKLKWRSAQPLRVEVLGFRLEIPKPYLECAHCATPGVSVVSLLTGLSSGEASAQLKLATAYCASAKSYGESRRDLWVHYGQELERTKVRRITLAIEQEALAFAEGERRAQLARLGGEARTVGAALILTEADGGKVRTGALVACEEGDAGYGKRMPKRGLPRRKRPTTFREVITMDAREPGVTECTALDVLVPAAAPPGERARRMLALAGRVGLGSNTRSVGLGDMGSELASSFEEAFFDYPGSWWNADWKHTCDYVEAVRKVLSRRFDGPAWAKAMKDAIWNRDVAQRDALLAQARRHRVKVLPRELEKCPVAALRTYLANNEKHMRFAELKALGLPFVSARAESQVRVRTKDRFCVAGAWCLENVEPKATLRSIIADGRWEAFRAHVLARHRDAFECALLARLARAVDEGRLSCAQVEALGLPNYSASADAARAA